MWMKFVCLARFHNFETLNFKSWNFYFVSFFFIWISFVLLWNSNHEYKECKLLFLRKICTWISIDLLELMEFVANVHLCFFHACRRQHLDLAFWMSSDCSEDVNDKEENTLILRLYQIGKCRIWTMWKRKIGWIHVLLMHKNQDSSKYWMLDSANKVQAYSRRPYKCGKWQEHSWEVLKAPQIAWSFSQNNWRSMNQAPNSYLLNQLYI